MLYLEKHLSQFDGMNHDSLGYQGLFILHGDGILKRPQLNRALLRVPSRNNQAAVPHETRRRTSILKLISFQGHDLVVVVADRSICSNIHAASPTDQRR